VLIPLARSAGASALMGLCLVYLKAVPLFAVIPLGVVIYLAVLVGTGTFSPAELRTVKTVITERVSSRLAQREKSVVNAG
jgi:hypothetical protein